MNDLHGIEDGADDFPRAVDAAAQDAEGYPDDHAEQHGDADEADRQCGLTPVGLSQHTADQQADERQEAHLEVADQPPQQEHAEADRQPGHLQQPLVDDDVEQRPERPLDHLERGLHVVVDPEDGLFHPVADRYLPVVEHGVLPRLRDDARRAFQDLAFGVDERVPAFGSLAVDQVGVGSRVDDLLGSESVPPHDDDPDQAARCEAVTTPHDAAEQDQCGDEEDRDQECPLDSGGQPVDDSIARLGRGDGVEPPVQKVAGVFFCGFFAVGLRKQCDGAHMNTSRSKPSMSRSTRPISSMIRRGSRLPTSLPSSSTTAMDSPRPAAA